MEKSYAIFGYWKKLDCPLLHQAIHKYLNDVTLSAEEVDTVFRYLRGWKIMCLTDEELKKNPAKYYQPNNHGVNQAIQDLLEIGIDPL